MNFLITSHFYPKNDYDIGSGQFMKVVRNPYDLEGIKNGKLSFLNGQIWKYSIIIPDSYQHINDLVLFHTFVTNNSQTYHYAENSNKLSFEDDELEFGDNKNLIGEGGSAKIVDFKKFPLLMSCNRIPESQLIFEYVDYKTSFEKFLELKTKKIKGLTGKYNLYDLISLYEFARNFEITHRLYRNTNLPLSFYITILESLIGKPEGCKIKLHCEDCGADVPHSKVSLEKHFEKYFKQFKSFRSIRHKTFHSGSSFDFGKYFSDLYKSKTNWTEDKILHHYRHEREEMECVIRILLTGEFFKYCRNEISPSSNSD